MTKRRFGKVLELYEVGPVLEVLPHTFAEISDPYNPVPTSTIFFDRFARTRREYGHREISEGLFQDALSELGRRVGTIDLAPGLDWSDDQVGFAALIATGVHINQQDKLGFPYIEHPRRVFLNAVWSLRPENLNENERVIGYQAAWLHDVLEDSMEFFYRGLTAEDLTAWGFSDWVVSVISKLTRPRGEQTTDAYYSRILLDPISRAVKLADIADNLAAWRVELLPTATRAKLEKKYKSALDALLFDKRKDGDWLDLRTGSFDQDPWPVFALSESHQALRRLRDRSGSQLELDEVCTSNLGAQRLLGQIQEQAWQVAKNRIWLQLDPTDSPDDWVREISLEAWYTAYLMVKVQSEGRNGDPREAERLASVIDQVHRSENSLQLTHLGLLPKDMSSDDVKLRLPRALELARKATDAMTGDEGQPRFDGQAFMNVERILKEADDEALLDATVIAFIPNGTPWMGNMLKLLLIELTNRMSREGF